ncbi:ABC transporter ATP-binding protein [Fumia xinanensis]|uniref:ABC transporter ATP-binding protein n=1 Tax=Fumia xinanensis TaxID=2763659 RepID=A0A926E5L6_9FIRM|nr:ABC transporter ATP-binding protein [Fumia xinanensis]MBC8560692.1 ABC transporter ATP-binding protein [Fumia xinanensis]
MENLIEIQDVFKIYPSAEDEVKALRGINITVGKGEFVAVVGSSGSGKSTMMNILGCLDVPTTGSYFLDGQDVSHFSDDELSTIRNEKIGFIFQGFHLIPGLSALENVELPLLYRGVPRHERKAAAIDALTRMGLASRLHHCPNQMSGGQQQRVAIARAIVGKPPIILADEPTGNLDQKTGAEVMSLLKELHQEGKTIVLITHDQKVAACAQRIIEISDGQAVQEPELLTQNA